jgi:hypothetical protein
VGLGPLDPTNRNRLTFYCPGAGIAFMAELDPQEDTTWRRVRFSQQVDANRPATTCHEMMVWWSDPAGVPATTARDKMKILAKKGKLIGATAFSFGRKHVHKLPSLVKVLGYFHSPASLVFDGLTALVHIDNTAVIGEDLVNLWRNAEPPRLDDRVVGNVEEAKKLIKDWSALGKPDNMTVRLAPGISNDELAAVVSVFIQMGAAKLLRKLLWNQQ